MVKLKIRNITLLTEEQTKLVSGGAKVVANSETSDTCDECDTSGDKGSAAGCVQPTDVDCEGTDVNCATDVSCGGACGTVNQCT